MKKSVLIGILIVLAIVTFFIFKPAALISRISPQGSIDPGNLTGAFDGSHTTAYFNNQALVPPTIAQYEAPPTVLGATNVHKRIEIDLANQRLYGYENDTKIYDFLVSTGKWGLTPVGRLHIWIKLRYALMTGGNRAIGTFYYLPNVPYTMYLYNDEIPQSKGYGIHGAYWHNNFGHPMSHGCINMREEDAKQLYYWADPQLGDKQSIRATPDNLGTEVVIYGITPSI